MNLRVIASFVAIGAVAFACGPRARTNESSTAKSSVRHHRAPAAKPLVASVDVDVASDVRFALSVTNASAKGVEIDFPNAQTHDFAVLDSTGKEVWRWSRTRLFTSALQTKPLGADDSHVYEDSWTPEGGAHGRYTVVATLASSNFPLEQRAEFTLP
ncbi:MAG: hypothetical protein HOQ09_09875 [Gemmatimonadaceae bacterium]|nr:hypothetical protein [Gemmatimonadaceae bacterium]